MKNKFIENYHKNFQRLINYVKVTGKKSKNIDFFQGINLVSNLIKSKSRKGAKVFFIGNGGSAAIASHMAVDFWKNGRMKAMAFNDSSLLTCISNDFGYEKVFAKPIQLFASRNDILFAISSSGKSENILQAVKMAKAKGLNVITLSGFKEDNPLRSLGIYNFYVPANEYGFVEVAHQYICHFILDVIINDNSKK